MGITPSPIVVYHYQFTKFKALRCFLLGEMCACAFVQVEFSLKRPIFLSFVFREIGLSTSLGYIFGSRPGTSRQTESQTDTPPTQNIMPPELVYRQKRHKNGKPKRLGTLRFFASMNVSPRISAIRFSPRWTTSSLDRCVNAPRDRDDILLRSRSSLRRFQRPANVSESMR